MFDHLQIADRRERWLVGVADAVLAAGVAAMRLASRSREPRDRPERILLLRLERIGDLLMAAPAIRAVRELAPHAEIDLVVGSWNEALAGLLAGTDRIHLLDVPWLARGERAGGLVGMARVAGSWRARDYDLAINFEGDIRSNLLVGFSRARRRVGFAMAGGGSLLTDLVPYDSRRHVSVNALRLVERAFSIADGQLAATLDDAPPLVVPADAADAAERLLVASGVMREGPFVGVHAGGDRQVKRWAPDRFADVARRLASRHGATVLLTGSQGDRAVNAEVRRLVGDRVPIIDLAGSADLLTLAALLRRMLVFVTGDTGPMHLAAALGVPMVAIFGPSDPTRWGPLSSRARVVRVSLPCSPCNRVRRPPARCSGRVPECLDRTDVDAVWQAALAVIAESASGARTAG